MEPLVGGVGGGGLWAPRGGGNGGGGFSPPLPGEYCRVTMGWGPLSAGSRGGGSWWLERGGKAGALPGLSHLIVKKVGDKINIHVSLKLAN